jgi:hypothetical protein
MSEEFQFNMQVGLSKNFKSEYDISKYHSKSVSKSLHQNKSRSDYDVGLKNKHKTQSTLNLSTTSQIMISPRLMGISKYQSTNSLQNSSYMWSFTKSDRFDAGLNKKPLNDSIIHLPDTKSERYTSQGYGHRSELSSAAGRNSPPPNKYFIKSCFDLNIEKKKGPKILGKLQGMVQ